MKPFVIKNNTYYRTFTMIVFLAAVLLRIFLSFVNSEANDAHMSVCRIILNEGRLPVKDEVWEGYHPKLYHNCVAAALNLKIINR